jgi:hypothetical protein
MNAYQKFAQTERSLLPEDWPDNPQELSSQALAVALCQRYLQVRATPFVFAFLAGSFSRDQQSMFSDVDLWVVEQGSPPMLREQVMFEHMSLQIGSLSLPDAYLFVQSGQKSANPFFIGGAAEAVLVTGDADSYLAFTSFAKATYAEGPASPPRWRQSRKRVALINGYMKCRKAATPADFVACASRFLDLLCDYWQIRNGGWIYERTLATRRGAFPMDLNDALSDLLLTSARNPGPFLERATAVLKDLDAYRWSTSDCGPLPLHG